MYIIMGMCRSEVNPESFLSNFRGALHRGTSLFILLALIQHQTHISHPPLITHQLSCERLVIHLFQVFFGDGAFVLFG